MADNPPTFGAPIVRLDLAALALAAVVGITGTAGQVTVSPNVGNVVVSLPTSGTLPGAWHAATGFVIDAGPLTVNAVVGTTGATVNIGGVPHLAVTETGIKLYYQGTNDGALIRLFRTATERWSFGMDYDNDGVHANGLNAFHLFNNGVASDVLAIQNATPNAAWFGRPDVTAASYGAQLRVSGVSTAQPTLRLDMPAGMAGTAFNILDSLGVEVFTFDNAARIRMALIAANGVTSEYLIAQTGVDPWLLRNIATTGAFNLTQNATVRLAMTTPTVASAAGATLATISIPATTVTISGSTVITNTGGFNFMVMAAPAYVGTNNVNFAATLEINAPTMSGGGTLVNPYGLWNKGALRSDGDLVLTIIGGANAARLQYSNGSQLFILADSGSNPRWYVDLTNGDVNNYGTLAVLGGGTVTTSQPILNLTQTWNAGAVTFTGIKLNVTATASAAASLFVDLQLATVSQFSIGKTGNVITLGSITTSLNGAVSTPVIVGTGTWYSGGSATTTKPYVLIEPAGTTSTGWSTSGTGLGINAASGFTGDLINAQVAGIGSTNGPAFKVTATGVITISNGSTGIITLTPGNGVITTNSSLTLSGSGVLTAQSIHATSTVGIIDSQNNAGWQIENGTTANVAIGAAVQATAKFYVASSAIAAGIITFQVAPGAHTAVVAEKSSIILSAHTVAITGAIATFRDTIFNAATYNGVFTITSAMTVDIAAPIAGTATLTSSASLRTAGSVVHGTAALATTAVNGFLYIPTCAGPPTGVPETWAGTVPLIYDTTNDILYIYRGAWIRPKAVTGPVNVNWQ